MKLLLNSTPTALWHQIIQEAASTCRIQLSIDIESYLVFLLMRYLRRSDFARQIIALEYLASFHLPFSHKRVALQEVGDKCLLFSGFFPRAAERRHVNISYFVRIGQSAYDAAYQLGDQLFGILATEFVSMMDVLQSLKKVNELLPLELYDLWNETKSQRAFDLLKNSMQALPVKR